MNDSKYLEDFDKYESLQEEIQIPDLPRHHPSDVRFYLALVVWILIFGMLTAELWYAMNGGCANLQSTLDAFGLFDVAPMTLAGAISAFYFSERRD